MKNIYVLIIIFSFCFVKLSGQISEGGKPASFGNNLKSSVPVILLPYIDNSKLLSEDIENENTGLKPFRFAKTVEVNYNTNNSGKWDILENGDKIWRIGFYSEGALSLNVIFRKFIIPIGAKLFIYNEDRTEILGAFTNKNQIPTGKLATSIINANSIVVEYNEPKNTEFNAELEIYKVNHGYKPLESFDKDGVSEKSGACNVDINCSEGSAWQKEKRAVCKVIMSGTNMCSGALINNTLQDGTPFFLTANHCTGQPYDEWVFYFNYEHSTCNSSDGSINQTISGCQLKATATNIDFCLVQISSNPPALFKPYYAGWNLSTSATANSTCIHHPDGDVKKISKDYNSPSIGNYDGYEPNSHWLISQWDLGTTEQGSSGSPLFDANHRIIGSLTGGQAKCGNSINDYFSRFDLAWNMNSTNSAQLKHWLDPNNSGYTSINGYDPFNNVQCGTLTNLSVSDTLTVYYFGTQWGYWSGQNGYGFTEFADRFYTSTTKYVHSIDLPVFNAFSADSSNYITLKVWDNLNSKPNNVLASKDMLISEFNTGGWLSVGFHSAVAVIDTFYVGYKVYYNSPLDTFVVYQSQNRGDLGLNTAYTFLNNQWKPYSDLGINVSFGFDILLCNITNVKELKNNSYDVNIFPNPANNILNIVSSENKNLNINIYNLLGKNVFSKNSVNPISTIDITDLSSGMYIISVETEKGKISKRIIIAK